LSGSIRADPQPNANVRQATAPSAESLPDDLLIDCASSPMPPASGVHTRVHSFLSATEHFGVP
jgi:hypothetical protein